MSDLIDHPASELNTALAQVLMAAVNLHEAGKLEEAESTYRSLIDAVPENAEANYFLGVLLVKRERIDEGLGFLRSAVGFDPKVSAYWYTYIEALIVNNRVAVAKEILKLAREKGHAGAECDALAARLSVAQIGIKGQANTRKVEPSTKALRKIAKLYTKQQFREMEIEAQKLCRAFPGNGFAWKALSVALTIQKRDNEARLPIQRAAELLPDDADALRNLGLLLERDGAYEQAEVWLRKGLDIDPNHAESLLRLGHIMHSREDYDAAEPLFRHAVELLPNDFRAHAILSECLRMQGRHAETEYHHLAALAIADTLKVRSARLFHLSEVGTLSRQALFEEHVCFGQRARALYGQPRTSFANDRDPHKRLRVGFVSGDLRNHSIAHYLEPIIHEMKRRDSMDTYAYSNHLTKDVVTSRLRDAFTHWRDIYDLNDDAAEQRILADKIDILFDLSSHTNANRLELFVRRVAPVQASWLGYPETTGVDSIDYYLSDIKMTPVGSFDDTFVEKLVRLDGSIIFQPFTNAPSVNPLPALDNGFVTFASFNRSHKLGRPVIAAWSEILRRTPGTRMVIGAMSGEHLRQRLLQWFQEEDIDIDRLTFINRTSVAEYLNQHQHVDVCLDAFPYAGATTTLSAVWMGVPTVTFTGATLASRNGAAVAAHVGLDDFIGVSVDDFIERAVKISQDIPRLSEIRQNLRARFSASPWGRADLVGANFDRACQRMWAQWCNNRAPTTMVV
jgi:predicted O-linked N-acetylglucosamine transferase (SPINDLY family)